MRWVFVVDRADAAAKHGQSMTKNHVYIQHIKSKDTIYIYRYTIILPLSADSLLLGVGAAKHGQSITHNHVYTQKKSHLQINNIHSDTQ